MLIWQSLQGVYGVWRICIRVSLSQHSLPACIDAILLIEASTHSGKPHLINVERFLIVAKCFEGGLECLCCGHGKLWEGRGDEFEWEKLMKCAGGRDTRRISEEAQLSTNSLKTCFSECSFSFLSN